MIILFRRWQTVSALARGRIFVLWTKLELTDEEERLIHKYSLRSTVLDGMDRPGLFRLSLVIGALVGLLFFGLFGVGVLRSFNIFINPSLAFIISLGLGIMVGWLAYELMRERIMVKDLMYGRSFKCRSVIELARREAYLEFISLYLRQVVESSKHWGGTEKRELPALSPEEAKRYILKGPLL